METLMHTCCAPCSVSCIRQLREEGIEPVSFPYFGGIETDGWTAAPAEEVLERNIPVRRLALADGGDALVATVYDLLLAQYGIDRGFGGDFVARQEGALGLLGSQGVLEMQGARAVGDLVPGDLGVKPVHVHRDAEHHRPAGQVAGRYRLASGGVP